MIRSGHAARDHAQVCHWQGFPCARQGFFQPWMSFSLLSSLASFAAQYMHIAARHINGALSNRPRFACDMPKTLTPHSYLHRALHSSRPTVRRGPTFCRRIADALPIVQNHCFARINT
jgi:hypothetical protein